MLKIHNTVLAALTFFTISFTASAKAEEGTPCDKPGNENLMVMNEQTLKTFEGLARGNSILTAQQRVNFCDTIDNISSGTDTLNQIKYLSRTHKLSVDSFLSDHIDNVVCNGKHIVFHAIDKEKEDIVAFIEAGLDVNRALPNTDGRLMTALDWAYMRMDSTDSKDSKVSWRRKIYELKAKRGAKRCSELQIKCKLR